MVFSHRDKMKTHLKSVDFHGVVFDPERRGRPSAYQRPGQSSRVSPETLRSPSSRRSPSRRRDNHRRSRTPARSRRERRRPVSSDSDRSASPQALPVVSGVGVRQSGHRSSGDLRISIVRGIVVGSVGAVGDVVVLKLLFLGLPQPLSWLLG